SIMYVMIKLYAALQLSAVQEHIVKKDFASLRRELENVSIHLKLKEKGLLLIKIPARKSSIEIMLGAAAKKESTACLILLAEMENA
ncbi:MAG: hypothetical protein AABX49_00295, partial [Nanoarchaeota archaeon]